MFGFTGPDNARCPRCDDLSYPEYIAVKKARQPPGELRSQWLLTASRGSGRTRPRCLASSVRSKRHDKRHDSATTSTLVVACGRVPSPFGPNSSSVLDGTLVVAGSMRNSGCGLCLFLLSCFQILIAVLRTVRFATRTNVS